MTGVGLLGVATRGSGDLHEHGAGLSLDAVVLLLAALAVAAYVGGAVSSTRAGRPWPLRRGASWCAGVVVATVPVVGPLAVASHDDPVAHMWGHLLGGMLAPLFLVLAAPVTLALRTLPVTPARRVSALLRSPLVRLVAHPVTAGLLSAGGLWVLYRTPVLAVVQASPLAHLVVHAHVVLAGTLFAAVVLGVDPVPHPPRPVVVGVVLVLTFASHAVLAKGLAAWPPDGLPVGRTEAAAELMYGVGALLEAALVALVCARWYRAAGRRLRRAAA